MVCSNGNNTHLLNLWKMDTNSAVTLKKVPDRFNSSECETCKASFIEQDDNLPGNLTGAAAPDVTLAWP